jgi:hypothetical protein
MPLVLHDLPRDPDRLLPMLQQMAEVIAQQNAALVELRAEHDTVLAERDTAQAEIEKLRLLIRQLQRGRFGRRSEKRPPRPPRRHRRRWLQGAALLGHHRLGDAT